MDDGKHGKAIEHHASDLDNSLSKQMSRQHLQHKRSRETRFQNDLAHLIPR